MCTLSSDAGAVAELRPRSLKYLAGTLQQLVRGRLWLQVLIGMVAGLAVGILIGPSVDWVAPGTAKTLSDWLALPGHLFLALIQMIVIPLVFASIIRGLAASEDLEQLRRVGTRVALYFVGTTAVAIVIGIVYALWIEPGRFIDPQLLHHVSDKAPMPASSDPEPVTLNDLPERIVTLVPANPLMAMAESNMLEVVIFAIIVGIALVIMAPNQSKPLLDLLGSVQEVCMTVVRWAMWLAPLAVFGLLASLTARLGLNALVGMAVYVATVLIALLTLFGLYLLLIYFVTRMKPLAFLRAVREVVLLAFSTSSSAAVMPLSIKTAEEQLGVRPSISQFVIPLGATINMNGTALYQGVAAIFLAQVFGVDIGLGGMVLIVVTAVGAAVGAPATPGVGIVVLAMILTSVGIPAAGIALIMGVDRILDMCRTAVNVSGDLVAAKLMDRWIGGKQSVEEQHAQERRDEAQRARTGEDVLTSSH